MPRRKRRQVQYLLRLHPGQDDELIHWLEQFDDQSYGVKSQAVKRALLQGIGGGDPGQGSPVPALDLTEIRRVVEAAVTQALARFEGQVAGAAMAAPEEDDETESLLDDLGAALVLMEPE